MFGRIIEITETGRTLRLNLGSVEIFDSNGAKLARIALDEIAGIICYPHGSLVTAALMAELARRNIPLVVSGNDFSPVGVLTALDGNFEQAKRIEAQINSSAPRKKQLWADVVRQKIAMQALALEIAGRPNLTVANLRTQVRSGDSQNCEAQAARLYFTTFFGNNFRRDRDLPGINALLNYGYAVLRASTARALVAAGLHPSIGIFHRNAYNGMRLADDIMEPFRPLVDLRVRALIVDGVAAVTPETKRALVDVLSTDVPHIRGITPVSVAVQYAATSLAKCFLGDAKKIEFPVANMQDLYFDFMSLPRWWQNV